ncbi:MAG: hypothetical protein DRN96_04165 [Thermoproteota archaeon]|nr:MAG: hypothetical protein DRN96_04165 [Candidatus Korarchaeota archaeon]
MSSSPLTIEAAASRRGAPLKAGSTAEPTATSNTTSHIPASHPPPANKGYLERQQAASSATWPLAYSLEMASSNEVKRCLHQDGGNRIKP